jgi:hypothetical protein
MVKEQTVSLNFQEEQYSKEETSTLQCDGFGTIQQKAAETNT